VNASARAWVLPVAETVALAIFFYCATVVSISAGNECRFNEVVVSCDSLGARLTALHVAVTCDIYIHVDRSSTYDVVLGALQPLRESGFLTTAFVNSEPGT
jgi:biopolymer transport protein ExbD